MFEDFVRQREQEIAEKQKDDLKKEERTKLEKEVYTKAMSKRHEVAGGTGDALTTF